MTLTDPMNGGSSTARVPTPDAADRARNEATQAHARGNLAAIICDTWGVDLAQDKPSDRLVQMAAKAFAELAGALGLEPTPERRPGYCACGVVLPMSSASTSAAEDYAAGHCFVCTRKARRP